MFGLGIKKPPRLDRFPLDAWNVAQGEFEGKPMVIRINTGARNYIAHPELPFRLGITVSFNTPNEHGFCSGDEGDQLSAIEDTLTECLGSEQIAFPVLVVTCAGRREYIFYASDTKRASQTVERCRIGITSHQLQFAMESDTEWSYFAQFCM